MWFQTPMQLVVADKRSTANHCSKKRWSPVQNGRQWVFPKNRKKSQKGEANCRLHIILPIIFLTNNSNWTFGVASPSSLVIAQTLDLTSFLYHSVLNERRNPFYAMLMFFGSVSKICTNSSYINIRFYTAEQSASSLSFHALTFAIIWNRQKI